MNIRQHNPMHRGAFIKRVYLVPFSVRAKALAVDLPVSELIVSQIINAKGSAAPPMALSLFNVLGRSAESGLLMQYQRDLWVARQTLDLNNYHALQFD